MDRLKISDNLNEVTVQDIRALRSHGISLSEIEKAIRETDGIGEEKLNLLLDDVVARNQLYYREMVDLAKVTEPQTYVDEADISAIRRQTWAAYRNITTSMGFLVVQNGRLKMLEPVKACHWALDSATLQIQSGAISYAQAIQNAVRQLADSGLKVVDYESGHHNQIDVAARRAVMTAVNQISDKYVDQSAEYLNTRYFETSAHLGARNIPHPNPWSSHEDWQGFVYYMSDHGEPDPLGLYKDLVETTGYGKVDGLTGANCRHRRWAFIPGVMERTHSDEELELMKAKYGKFTYEGKEYNRYSATQQQRNIETAIRHWKRREASSVTDDEKAAAKTRLRRLNKKYREFSKAAGLPEQRDRLNVIYT